MGTMQASHLPPMSTQEFAKVVRCFASFHRTSVDLGAITVPMLALVGEHEPAFVHRHAARIVAEVPGATTAVIPHAGHASSLDNPRAFNQALRAFLAGLPAQMGPQKDGPADGDDPRAAPARAQGLKAKAS